MFCEISLRSMDKLTSNSLGLVAEECDIHISKDQI